jgi:GST-like protein
MNERLAARDFLAGTYSIADMACWTWSRNWRRQGQNIDDFPHFKAWFERVAARPAGRARGPKSGRICAIPTIRSAKTRSQ